MPRLSVPRVPAQLLSAYREVGPIGHATFGASGSTTEWVTYDAGVLAVNSANSAWGGFYLNPAWWPDVLGKTAKLRLSLYYVVNATVGGMGTGWQLTGALKPIGTPGGTAANDTRTGTLGAAVASVAVTGHTASTTFSGTSADFAAPAAGFYLFSLTANQAAAANSNATVTIHLQQRWA